MPSGIDTILSSIRNKTILILGFGREGKSTLKFLLEWMPEAEFGIADLNPVAPDIQINNPNIRTFDGEYYLEAVSKYELIIKTPGIPGRFLSLRDDQILTSQTDLFLAAFHKQTIGVTGTKGKSTTSTLIHHLLLNTGFKSILTGNIGIPCFDILPQITDDSKVVFELSANQLEYVRHSPAIAVLLNIYEEHLDHFGTFEAYKNAKLNLIINALPGDTLILHKDLSLNFDLQDVKTELFPTSKFPVSFDLKLPGEHNQWNAQAAVLACIAAGADFESLKAHLATFKGLSHRLEYVGEKSGVHFYNDSIATIPEACIAALQTFKKVDFLFLGGFDRGIHYSILTDYIKNHPVRHILLTGDAGKRIGNDLADLKHPGISLHYFKTMEEAFRIIHDLKQTGDVCLLSPAAASYDQYKNFEHRGEVFKSLVADF